ncbi:hypothetical protein BST26_02980 [Mycolicibacterium insubricum]|uniref:Uncharacterized protein n=2 Tax=Mycolicibacterium insubricum TaxID=444597 RepID=A0A1X0DM21_9MYCO|nr:hypothetical protein BST26_02980 [Mycolicibacterium insubricum]
MFVGGGTSIGIGLLILTSGASLLAFLGAAITHQIRRCVGFQSPLGTAQSLAAACLILEFIVPQMIWQAARYRPERNPELIQLCFDLGWLMFIGVVSTAMVQMLLLAVAVLQDPRRQPLVPRWVAYLSIWAAISVAAGGFCVFVQTGPLTWNGVIGFWLLATAFFVWIVAISWAMLKATKRSDDVDQALPGWAQNVAPKEAILVSAGLSSR